MIKRASGVLGKGEGRGQEALHEARLAIESSSEESDPEECIPVSTFLAQRPTERWPSFIARWHPEYVVCLTRVVKGPASSEAAGAASSSEAAVEIVAVHEPAVVELVALHESTEYEDATEEVVAQREQRRAKHIRGGGGGAGWGASSEVWATAPPPETEVWFEKWCLHPWISTAGAAAAGHQSDVDAEIITTMPSQRGLEWRYLLRFVGLRQFVHIVGRQQALCMWNKVSYMWPSNLDGYFHWQAEFENMHTTTFLFAAEQFKDSRVRTHPVFLHDFIRHWMEQEVEAVEVVEPVALHEPTSADLEDNSWCLCK